MGVLFGQATSDSVRYTTAKLVLVGDSGVGKTGLGWRLAHSEFKEHASTHGQQFWVVDELGKTRDDGTLCEAVLWDLAGQPIYRHGHPLFLDNVDHALLLFDPTKGMESLQGVEFWINQLSGKDIMPPSILVGARVDRGDSVLTLDELSQFCQRYHINGGYIRTSAKENIGLDLLMDTLKSRIPWDEMTTTVTTVTFKRIKEFVLSLKEHPERAHVLVSPKELRAQLESTDTNWEFSDAEMMTAVGHLENHGYVTVLRTSDGMQSILLTPDLLVNLVSSIVIEASRHPRNLGSLNETQLLKGGFAFPELEGLSGTECAVLSDAAILRFLEHNICFRTTLGADHLLVFPALIQQKRPLFDEFESTDDVSYIVRGAIENVYAALVVLLGYTQSFTRVNQWHNQAQYEMEPGEICGFRRIEERTGEVEFILYYATTTPTYARTMFQGLFEKFLYQRDVEVTRYPPVSCINNHLQDRSTVMRMLRQGKTQVFCPECGGTVELPSVAGPQALGEIESDTVDHADTLTQLRRTYELHLSRIKGFRRDRNAPRCYLSHLPNQKPWTKQLIGDLRDAGVYIVEERTQLKIEDFILLLCTKQYKEAWKNTGDIIAKDVPLIQKRLKASKGQRSTVIPLIFEDNPSTYCPQELLGHRPGDFRDETRYAVELYDLLLSLYAIPFNHPAFEPLRQSLQKQWEETLAGRKLPPSEIFISYGWGGESEDIANELDQAFQDRGITLIRDKRDLGFKGQIQEFMDSIGEGRAIVLIISEKYLKSANCCYELVHIAKNESFLDRVFPVVLNDAKIYDPKDRLHYVKYWEEKKNELDDLMKTVSSANLEGFRDDIDLYAEIRALLPGLINILKNMNTLTQEIHRTMGFVELIEAVTEKVNPQYR